jgi:hypothetical protein
LILSNGSKLKSTYKTGRISRKKCSVGHISREKWLCWPQLLPKTNKQTKE